MKGKVHIIRLGGDWAPYNREVTPLMFAETLFINLEGPVLEKGSANYIPTAKAGPSLHSTVFPNCEARGIVTLANNHLFDYGQAGYEETLRTIQREQWLHLGAGSSKKEASEPVVFSWEGRKVGVVARCEIQFGIAQENSPGAAGFDATVFEQIEKLKSETDIVIASIHAGAEMLPWPSPHRQETLRALIDAGADIVHGHHAHVPQGWEEYNGGLIFYGLGNFCVDPAEWSWHPNGLWSLAPELTWLDERIAMTPKTTVIEEHGQIIAVRESAARESEKHHEYLAICNRPLSDRILLEGLWQEASIRMHDQYFADWLGFDVPPYTLLHRSLRNALGKLKRKYINRSGRGLPVGSPQSKYLLRYHLFACDSHRDAISTALGVLGGELIDLRTAETAQLVDRWMISK